MPSQDMLFNLLFWTAALLPVVALITAFFRPFIAIALLASSAFAFAGSEYVRQQADASSMPIHWIFLAPSVVIGVIGLVIALIRLSRPSRSQ